MGVKQWRSGMLRSWRDGPKSVTNSALLTLTVLVFMLMASKNARATDNDAAIQKMLADFERKAHDNLALDHGERLVYIAPTRVNLNLTEERWPSIEFRKTREH